MLYTLEDLLKKIGAPDVTPERRAEWRYFRSHMSGLAEVRLESGGARLIAELKHIRERKIDDTPFSAREDVPNGVFVETCSLEAVRTNEGLYRVHRVAFDDVTYAAADPGVTELALSIFHARALEIGIRMTEQAFNKGDILERAASAPVAPARTSACQIIPFPMMRRAMEQPFSAGL